jgi:hypothetical protein
MQNFLRTKGFCNVAARVRDTRTALVVSLRSSETLPSTEMRIGVAGANLDNGDPEKLLFSMTRFFKFLPQEQRQAFLEGLS